MNTASTSPPPGGDVSRGPTVLGVFSMFTFVGLTCLLARLYTRIRLLRSPGWDDAILTFTMFGLIIPNLIFSGMQVKYGLGRHSIYLTEEQVLQTIKWNFICNPFGILAVCVPKIAVVIFIHKLVGKAHRVGIYILYFLAVTNVIFSIADTFVLFFQCDPPDAPWNPHGKPKCWNPNILLDFTYFVGAYSAFIDLVLALYPATFIWRLKMKTKQKAFTSCIMGLGLFACACAIIRTTTLKSLGDPTDATWRSATRVVWSGAEANVIVICASVPAILPLIQQLAGIKDYRSRSSSTQNAFAGNDTSPDTLHSNEARDPCKLSIRSAIFDGRSEKSVCSEGENGRRPVAEV